MSVWRRLWARAGRLLRRSTRQAPPAPGRFEEAVQLFRFQRPKASPEEWQAFTLGLVAQAYAQGLARGSDQAKGMSSAELERLHGWRATDGRPELVKALAGRDPRDPLAGVSLEDRQKLADELGRAVRAGVELRLTVAPPGPRAHHRPT